MKTFHELSVVSKRQETRDSVRIALQVPDAEKHAFEFQAGQHLPIQIEQAGKKLRRTYSICSEQGQWPLEIGIRVQEHGQFSGFAADELVVGDSLQVMPPSGRFYAHVDAGRTAHHLAFAAGSGITPILSIVSTLLRDEPASSVSLFYGNRTQSSTMFIDDLFALKNRYKDRLLLHFLFSQEQQEFEIAGGRLDAAKVRELIDRLCQGMTLDDAYVCGPDTMISDVADALTSLGMASGSIHAERFGVPPKLKAAAAPSVRQSDDQATVTVIMDGQQQSFAMPKTGINIVDAAAEHDISLPFSCKAGVCATCRTHVREGDVSMATNYGLESWEVENGFVLACQSMPLSENLVLDYDKT